MAKKNNTKRKIIALVSNLTKHRTYVTRKNTINTLHICSFYASMTLLLAGTLLTMIRRNRSAVTRLNRAKASLIAIIIKNSIHSRMLFFVSAINCKS